MKQSFMTAVLCLWALFAGPAHGHDRIRVLHSFDSSGYIPYGNITLSHHAIFGTTAYGGKFGCPNGCGTVYRLVPGAGGGQFETLYRFTGGKDGGDPYTQLTVAPNGDVYGYTNIYTQGTIFRLMPPSLQGGAWTFEILYIFKNGADGNLQAAAAPLIIHGGQLYGVASGGNPACQNSGCGSLFRLDPPAPGKTAWRLVTLYAFGAKGNGAPSWITGPDASGALYVSTDAGKAAIVRLTARPGNADDWKARVIATFPGGKSYLPYNLVLAPGGTIYGLGPARRGDIFSLTPPPGGGDAGRWTLAEIANVSNQQYTPSSLALGPAGSLIGVIYGDQDLYPGNAFQLTPPPGGAGLWTYTQLWSFYKGPDQNPNNIVAGPSGDLFGVLSSGGYGVGTIFALRPRL